MFGGDLLLYTSVVLIGIAVFMVTSQMFIDEDGFKAQDKLDDELGAIKINSQSMGLFLSTQDHFFVAMLLLLLTHLKIRKELRISISKKLPVPVCLIS